MALIDNNEIKEVFWQFCDTNGVLLGVNKYNNSPVIIDIFDFFS